MVIATPSTAKLSSKKIVDLWSSLPTEYLEKDLGHNFMSKLFEYLGLTHNQIKNEPNIGTGKGLQPDYLIYNDPTHSPVLVIEIKKRKLDLAQVSDANFISTCQNHSLYQDAVGLPVKANNNGIVQYLDINKVKPDCLANYGLVFNGDFFQLWRRVDGLVIPMTTIERVNKTNLPKLLKELAKCLRTPPSALITAIWNSKGGVAKTTNTINVASCLALTSKRVLLIDLDPQNDLTTGIGLKSNYAPDYFDRAYEQLQLQELGQAKDILMSSIQTKSYPTSDGKSFHLSLLSSSRDFLNDINDNIRPQKPQVIFNYLLNLIRYNYDYILIDCSPKRDKLAECLLCNADVILFPIDLGSKSLKHAINLSLNVIPTIKTMRNKTDNFTIGPWNLGLVSSKCPNQIGEGIKKASSALIEDLGFTGKQVSIHLLDYAQINQAEYQGKPVVCWQNSPITKLFHKLTDEVFLNHNYTNN
ncbi:AAA family ATPase [Chamaesiphon sp. VAR_48_metabat_135_sub]|uniref:ParA family protein n=1 Tax=Chamaesiphon sp. VAR_48_metabat_135_sub TaxID=2964699 RepID=UPI00286A89C6|nr:AAA family ATPase [Chamaesiphon sp. VAR_48_metabat_135_sub]